MFPAGGVLRPRILGTRFPTGWEHHSRPSGTGFPAVGKGSPGCPEKIFLYMLRPLLAMRFLERTIVIRPDEAN